MGTLGPQTVEGYTFRQVEPRGGLVTLSISLLIHVCPWNLFLRKQISGFYLRAVLNMQEPR